MLEIMSSGTYGSVMTIGEGAQQLFLPFGAEPAVATSGWKQRAALGLLTGGMWVLPSCHRRSRLSSLFQGPAERWRRQQSPSDGRMVVLRQFGLLLWKNYILQVGSHCALMGLPLSPLHVETAELAPGS